MSRRRFLLTLAATPLALLAATRPRRARGAPPSSMQSYAYYQGLDESEEHDPGRDDGTTYNMPCITAAEIAAGLDKSYTFWHGHDGMDHLFTVAAADFAQLQLG